MTPTPPSIIAIDGPAASGKSTLGLRLAQALHYLFFDTGVMYRAVTWLVLKRVRRPCVHLSAIAVCTWCV